MRSGVLPVSIRRRIGEEESSVDFRDTYRQKKGMYITSNAHYRHFTFHKIQLTLGEPATDFLFELDPRCGEETPKSFLLLLNIPVSVLLLLLFRLMLTSGLGALPHSRDAVWDKQEMCDQLGLVML